MPDNPVVKIATDPSKTDLKAGTALCLSGGGYRAMLFHVGTLWRLYEARLLEGYQKNLECLGRFHHGRGACLELAATEF